MQITVTCPVRASFRVSQIAGMFDVPLEQKTAQTFEFEEPPLSEPWNIGLIVGPSGSGKSTVARRLFGDEFLDVEDWPADKAVVDGFGDMSIKDITRLLTAVGFASPPSWIKPYHVLSNGEKFRCDLARTLSGIQNPSSACPRQRPAGAGQDAERKGRTGSVLDPGSGARALAVFDEYTSVVDRNVAKIASAAIAKGIKSGTIACRFVAVTCHYDVADWLEPDWVLDMALGTVSRRRLRRPGIELRIVRCERRAWSLFAKHHYLNGNLPVGTRCYLALWNDAPVAFCAVIALIGRRNRRRVSRIVTLPDYQGIGIGGAFLEALGDLHREDGLRFSITASHPSVIAHCGRSAKWKTVNIMKIGSKHGKHRGSRGRAVVSFEYDP